MAELLYREETHQLIGFCMEIDTDSTDLHG